MKRIARIALLATVLALVLAALCACSSSTSYTFKVATGDDVEVKLDTSDGLDLEAGSEDYDFTVVQDGEELLNGSFIYASGVNDVIEQLESSGFTVQNHVEVEGASGDLYAYVPVTGPEQDVIVLLVNESSTGVVLESTEAEVDPIGVALLLSFSLDE